MSEETTRKGISRRSFLKTSAVAGAAAGLLAPAATALAAQSSDAFVQPEEQTFANLCRGNCGGAGSCTLNIKVRDGKVVQLMPNTPAGEGVVMRFGCVKGQTNPQRIYSSYRLLYPMKQTGEKGSDNWERITWDEALSTIANKIQAAQKTYGDSSVGLWTYGGNSDGYLGGLSFGFFNNGAVRPKSSGIGFERFAQKTGLTMFYGSGDLAELYIEYSLLGAAMGSAEDFVNAKTILLWGANPAEAYKPAWPFIVRAKQAGATIVAIDPRFSTSASHADMWVPIRPGTDGALILAMCNHIIENDWIDYDYFRNHSIAPLLLKEDGTYLRMSDLASPEPTDGEEETGATGASQAHDTSEVVYDPATESFGSSRQIINPALTGKYIVNGMNVRTVYDYVLENIEPYTVEFAEKECGIPADTIRTLTALYANNKPASLAHWWGMEHLYNSWRMYFGVGLLASLTGNACKHGASYTPSYSFSQYYVKPRTTNFASRTIDNPKTNLMITSNRIPEVLDRGEWNGTPINLRVLLIMGTNPMESCVDYHAHTEAFKRIDCVVVHDQFMTDTAKWADIVLPCTTSFEEEDFNGRMMRQKCIEPEGESRSNFELFVSLANALGYTDLYEKDAEGYLREILDTPENLAAGLGYDTYHERGYVEGSFYPLSMAGTETNPTGRTQFYLQNLPARDYPDLVIPIEDRLPSYSHAYEAYPDNPLREKYPLFGITYHDNYTGQSMFSHVSWLKELRGYKGEPYAVISEKASAERGIVTGDKVKVFNERGFVVLRAVVSKGLQEETVVVPRGYGMDEFEDGNANSLSNIDAVDKVCSNDSHNDWLCQVEKM